MRERQYITVSTQLTPEVVKRIEDESNTQRISRSQLIRDLIEYAMARTMNHKLKGSAHE